MNLGTLSHGSMAWAVAIKAWNLRVREEERRQLPPHTLLTHATTALTAVHCRAHPFLSLSLSAPLLSHSSGEALLSLSHPSTPLFFLLHTHFNIV